MTSDVTLATHYVGKTVSVELGAKTIIGVVSDISAQGVVLIWGDKNELSTFLPWTSIVQMTYTQAIHLNDDTVTSVTAEATVVSE